MPIDYNKYPDNWETEIVPAVRERSGDKCEVCGLENGQDVWSIKLRVREVKNGKSRYKKKAIWFRNKQDAEREATISPPKKVTVVLTTAHLDHDEENEDIELDRLLHKCQICHLRYDAEEKAKRILNKNK